MRYYAYALLSFPILAPMPASAQTPAPPPDQIVVTATRIPTKTEQIAGGVTIIDRATIEAFGDTDLVQALSDVPGLRVAQAGGPGAQASVFIRGTNSNQVLVLRDGIPINDPGTPGGAFNFGDDTLNDIQRIEIIRGPMASVYGSGAIGGVINLITVRPKDGMQGDATLAGGSQGSFLGRGHIAGRDGMFDYAATLESTASTGFDQTPPRESIHTGEADGFRARQGTLELGVTPLENTRVSLLLRGRTATEGYDQNIDAANAHGTDASAMARLAIHSTLLDGAWDTTGLVSRLQDWRHYRVTLDPLDPTQATENDHYSGARTDFQWNNVVKLPDAGALTQSAVSFGAEHANDSANTRIDSAAYGYPYLTGVRAHDANSAGYAGVQTAAFNRLTLSAQAREDTTSISGDAFTWRAGAVLAIPEASSHLKVAYGTGFRAPALYDLYGVDSYGYVGNPDLRPEHSTGWEAGLSTDLPIPPDEGGVTISATYFDNRLHDLIELQYAPVYTPVNIDKARAKGIEAGINFRFARSLSGDITYTYTDARDPLTKARLLRRPYNQAGGRLLIKPIPSVTIAPEVVYTGSFVDYLTNDQSQGIGDGLSPAGTIVNINLSWQAREHLQLFAWGKNLNASRFEPVNGYLTPGRSILAGGRYTF